MHIISYNLNRFCKNQFLLTGAVHLWQYMLKVLRNTPSITHPLTQEKNNRISGYFFVENLQLSVYLPDTLSEATHLAQVL